MWTENEVRQLYEAVRDKKIEKVKALMDIYQSRLEPINPLKKAHHFYIACTLGLDTVVDFYLSIPGIVDKITLYNGLEQAVQANETEVVELLLNKHKLDPNYIIPPHETFEYIVYGVERISMSLLAIACLRQKKDMVRCLLSHKNVNVNLQWDSKDVIGLTVLYYIAQQKDRWNLEITQLLLDAGADPLLTTIIKHTDKTVTPPVEREYRFNALDKAIYNKNVEAEALLNQWIKNGNAIQKRDSSPEPSSSGSNSPASAGSPQSSPPRHSAILQKTPPDSPVASRSVTPPGSPMHSSDNNSSGSAGSSPSSSNDTKPKIVYTVDKSLPKDRFEKRFYTRVSPSTPIEHIKEYYFSGVTLDWYAPDDGDNAFHHAVDAKYFSVAEAMLEWGVNINILDFYGRTIIQRIALLQRLPEQWMAIERLAFIFKDRPNLKQKPDINYQDRDGNTALHLAAAKGADEIVNFLLAQGANPRITNSAGLTAEEYAEKCENLEKRTIIKTKLRPYSVQQSQSVMRSPAEIQYRSQPASSSSYANSSSVMFVNNGAPNRAPLQVSLPPPTRSAPQTVGALYTPPPASTVELPRQTESQISSSSSKKSSSVSGIFKKVFGK